MIIDVKTEHDNLRAHLLFARFQRLRLVTLQRFHTVVPFSDLPLEIRLQQGHKALNTG